MAKICINLTEPTLHPELRNSLGHQLILTTSICLAYLAIKSSNVNSGQTMEQLVGMETALAFSKQINSIDSQAGLYWYLDIFSDNHITHFMQQLSQNCKKLMTAFSANRCILCEGHKTDDVCLRLIQQVCGKSIKLMLEYFAELGPLRVIDLIFVFSSIIHVFPAVTISSSAAHVCFTICWLKLKLE